MGLRYRSEAIGRRSNAALEIIEWVHSALAPHKDLVISVTNHQCGDPECVSTATTILLMRPDQPTLAVKIAKAIDAIREHDVADALQSILSDGRLIPVP